MQCSFFFNPNKCSNRKCLFVRIDAHRSESYIRKLDGSVGDCLSLRISDRLFEFRKALMCGSYHVPFFKIYFIGSSSNTLLYDNDRSGTVL